jgi:hypothetical protein
MYRIGFISASSPGFDPNWEVFVEKLRELGYLPSQNVVIERRAGEGRSETSYSAAAELLHGKIDVIWVGGTPGALAVKRATSTSCRLRRCQRPGWLRAHCQLVTSWRKYHGADAYLQASPREAGTTSQRVGPSCFSDRWSRWAELAAHACRHSSLQALGLQVDVVEVRAPDELGGLFPSREGKRSGLCCGAGRLVLCSAAAHRSAGRDEPPADRL